MIINKGIKKRPLKVLLYGTEGIGKSTFASQFPHPVFIDLESGTHMLNVDRVDGITKWDDLLAGVEVPHCTLVEKNSVSIK